MKILCLHGAYGSAEAQLYPFVGAVEKCGSVQFKWVDGGHIVTPPPGFETYFGAPPLYRFVDYDGISALEDVVSRVRESPQGTTPEDTIRKLVGGQEAFIGLAVRSTIDRLFEILDEDPEIDGVLGYSEGAMAAATLILEERRRQEEQGRPRRIKCAIFFGGWPPVRICDGIVRTVIADECEDTIDVPTCHIVGCNDPYIDGAMAPYGVCDEDTATLFDHGKGHTVPRDPRTIQELASAVEMTLRESRQCV